MPTVFSNPALVPAIVVDSITMEDVVGLSAALAGKAGSVHTHEQSEIIGLITALSAKASSSHLHEQSEITGLIDALAAKAASVHTHEQSEIPGLIAALAAKAASVHAHGQSEITGLITALAAKAAAVHTHTQAQVDGLPAALSGMMLAPIIRSAIEGRPVDGEDSATYQVAGVLNPDITPYVLETAGLAKWSSTGSLTPASSGMYVLMESVMFTDVFRILVYQDGVYTGKSFVSFPGGSGPGLVIAPDTVAWGASTTGGAIGVPVITLAPTGGTPAGMLGRLCIVESFPSPEIWKCVRLTPVLWVKVAQAADVMGI